MPKIQHDPETAMRSIIEDLYQREIEDEHRVDQSRTVTFNFTSADASMFAAIAKRFGYSTAAFGGEVFGDYVRLLFLALSPEDRRALAVDADADSDRYLQTKGAADYQIGRGQWVRYADICDEHEAKERGEGQQ